jgi:hypothetical protein
MNSGWCTFTASQKNHHCLRTMNQRYALIPAALFAACALVAQPTIDAGNNVPTAGSEYPVSTSQQWDYAGGTGPDQLYGHWMLVGAGNRIISYLAPSVTPTSAQIPGTVLLSTDGGTDTLFWGLTANGLEILGDKSGLGLIKYTDPVLEIKYPCTYQTTWNDAVNATYMVQGFNVQRTGTVNGNGDGYGRLELPQVALDNILRIKVRKVITDASPIVTIQRISETYYFFSEDVRHPVLRLQVDTGIVNNGAPAVTKEALWMYGNGNVSVADIDLDDVRFTAYPNPTSGAVNLSFATAEHGVRAIELLDATGRVVKQLPLVQRHVAELPSAFDASGMAPGVYHLRLIGENSVLGTQRLVVQ